MGFILIVLFSILWQNVLAQVPQKCSIKDSECQMKFYQNAGRKFAPLGFPTLGIPPLDPYHLKNVTVPVMDMLNLTLVDGECLGISNCTVLSFETNLETFHKYLEIVCDRIVIQGSYSIKANEFFPQLFKGNMHGIGNGRIVLEDWHFKSRYPFELVKRENGQIYTNANLHEAEYESDVLKNVFFTADSILVDDKDVTEDVITYMNKNGRTILKTFGKSFHKISAGYFFEVYEIFFNKVPTSSYFRDDLTPYLKKCK